MGQITRPAKTAGTTQFSTEVAAGADDILAAEVDAELNNIVAAINDLDDGNVSPSANIVGSKIATNSLPGDRVVDATLATGKLVPGATVSAAGLGGVTTNLNIGAVETDVVVTTVISTRGGTVLILGTLALFLAGADLTTMRFRLYRGGTLLLTWDVVYASSGGSTPLPFPIAASDVPPAPGTFTYKVTGQNMNAVGAGRIGSPGQGAGILAAVELA